MTKKIPNHVRKLFAQWGAVGGKGGSREDKVRAGKLGAQARIKKLTEQTHDNPTTTTAKSR